MEDLVALQGRSRPESLAPEAPRVLLSAAKSVGEEFGHPPLGTQVMAVPIPLTGTLQPCGARLHRAHPGETPGQTVDVVDAGQPALTRMRAKRQVGHRATGSCVDAAAADQLDVDDRRGDRACPDGPQDLRCSPACLRQTPDRCTLVP